VRVRHDDCGRAPFAHRLCHFRLPFSDRAILLEFDAYGQFVDEGVGRRNARRKLIEIERAALRPL
jgi:hypothetical protein